jgi:hypothetical protein
MSTENLDGIYSYPAAADLSAAQYQAVIVNTSGAIGLAGANSALVDGILHNAPKQNEMGRVIVMRGVVAKARLGTGGATLGALLTTDAVGKLVVATTGQNVVAKAHRYAGAAGDIIEVLWYGRGGGVAP